MGDSTHESAVISAVTRGAAMPLTGSARSTKATPSTTSGRKLVTAILDQLDSEWATLRHDSIEMHGQDEAGLLANFHSCTRCFLEDIGDPYTTTWPPEYTAVSRVPKLCTYLAGLQEADSTTVWAARERNLMALRQVWPAYRDLNPLPTPNGVTLHELEVPPMSWDTLVSNWPGETAEPTVQGLPTFSTQESADFHLASLAVLFLNRQLRLYLTDLKPYPDRRA